MRVLHFCLSNYFTDGFLYQENQLVREHIVAGHEVCVVASTQVFDSAGMVSYREPGSYIGTEGAAIIRLPYRRWLPHSLARRIRMFPCVRNILQDFKPDAIMFHGSSAWELLTVASYVRENPDVTFYIDSHADSVNSARGWASRSLLHRRFYAPILRRAMQQSGPLLCVSVSAMNFAEDVYGVPSGQLEFFPLGGRILGAQQRDELRTQIRGRLGISDKEILIVQSGKQNRHKKLPLSLRALAKVDNPDIRLAIAGVLQDDVREECRSLMAADPRAIFLGWQDADDLTALLCAADVYLQPGTQSATMQHSLCNGCAVILDKIPSHEPYIMGNGWLITSEEELVKRIESLPFCDLEELKSASLDLAEKMLDYARLSRRILR